MHSATARGASTDGWDGPDASSSDSDDDALDKPERRGVYGSKSATSSRVPKSAAAGSVAAALRLQAEAASGAVYRRVADALRRRAAAAAAQADGKGAGHCFPVTSYRGHKVGCGWVVQPTTVCPVTSCGVPPRLSVQLSPTCVALTADDTVAFTGGKDCCVVRWDVETGAKVVFKGRRKRSSRQRRRGGDSKHEAGAHSDTVLAAAASSDGRLVATAGADRTIVVWDVRTNDVAATFTGHRDTVSCLAFRRNTRTLFSGSFDRTVKIWNLDDMAYVSSASLCDVH